MQQNNTHEETLLGRIIERAREEEGLGLRELARASGVSAGQISRILAGKTSQPSVETLVRLAGALERDVDALLVLAESPESFGGARLDAARVRLLEAIESLPPVHRNALLTDESNLRLQIEEAARLEDDIGRLEVQLVESRAASDADGEDLAARSYERIDAGLNAPSESLEPEAQLRRLRAERDVLDEMFAAAIREAAARLFTGVRGRTPASTSTSSPAWHNQQRAAKRQTTAPRFSVRPLSELLPDPQRPMRDALERREPTADRELRHLLRVWEQLSAARKRRVAEFIEDQHRLSLHEQLSQDATAEPKEER